MSLQNNSIVIVGYARTPIGNFMGDLHSVSATALGATAIKAALNRANVAPEQVDEVYMGCVLTAGLGQAPARNAALKAGVPDWVACTTINKMCGSGMKAVMLASDQIRAGNAKIVIAGGMESMSNAPYLLTKARDGMRIGHQKVMDHMFLDGLEDPNDKKLMGCYAEKCAEHYQFDREQQDAYAIQSLTRAQTAIATGLFEHEIEPVTVLKSGVATKVDQDQQPGLAELEKIVRLKPVFTPGGTVTAANSSSISDGAAALVLMAKETAEAQGIVPLANIIDYQSHAQAPSWFTTAPIAAINKLLTKNAFKIDDIDLYEVNEAFAVVPMAVMQETGISAEKLNIKGGACALGHPIGASGARILVTLLSALEQTGQQRGLAAICIGGGEATAMAIEQCIP